MTARRFRQVDVFTATPLLGNALAVVVDAEGLDDDALVRLARWTNLSETAFLLPPTDPSADYRIRIFTPAGEFPFAGHPTLGSAHVWLDCGGLAEAAEVIVQECGVGLIEVMRTGGRLAFAAPPPQRSGPVDAADLARIVQVLRIDRAEVLSAQWVDNGPGWVAVELASADAVLAVRPGRGELNVGVVGLYPDGTVLEGEPHAYEVRGFFPRDGLPSEDPVTGSLNASVAQWLTGAGRVRPPYVATQGSVLGRDGRIHIDRDANGRIWVGGDVVTVVAGTVNL